MVIEHYLYKKRKCNVIMNNPFPECHLSNPECRFPTWIQPPHNLLYKLATYVRKKEAKTNPIFLCLATHQKPNEILVYFEIEVRPHLLDIFSSFPISEMEKQIKHKIHKSSPLFVNTRTVRATLVATLFHLRQLTCLRLSRRNLYLSESSWCCDHLNGSFGILSKS